MFIDPTQRPNLQTDTAAGERPSVTGVADTSRFEALLAGRAASPGRKTDIRETAAAAAELMRLDMMRSAFSLGDTAGETPRPVGAQAMEFILKSFAQNRGEVTGADAAQAEVGAPADVSAAEVSSTGPRDAGWLEDVIQRASRRYGVEVGLIKAVIKAESNFNPNAVSHAGAQGLMQLMPATARGLGVTDSFDPEQNVMAGTRFLKDLLKRYGGDIDKTLAAYNWGPGNVDRKPHLLPRETRDYLVKVKEYYSQFA
ncbi:lytic transglycosylase domain-containing protein [Geobacter sulfurreducens]|jgi:SLT domain-containing protein|uniref:Lytic transglycosylase domain protein n=1 Tax=Geobacter sulfurreducens (strain ATCC 51573 / DSM 12127 / PCA) TaxID=243231 RepID=Q74GE5_GEOSL|nr:lytic transglycosylase domain-containing protein [Geobacter sulfurreducens]AAR33634.2 lytic transglycosylase domain protein [Geobacter sulfurreducens PCA]ADI83133.1 lytic transglycosylase domain protein [Geobacter sulfurreducens KN400]AJY70026.1 lytic transglycosylase [Geobacter sulfurreducens]QVW35564.1 lytic transglycosylase domain-containing protein [Geobacter sulfurreducens]UAC04386.1 lytic transglycosylase domain-containing protein [Geobacter sulfurreducens]